MVNKILLLTCVIFTGVINAQFKKSVKQKFVFNSPEGIRTNELKSAEALTAGCSTVSTLSGTLLVMETAGTTTDTGCNPNAGYVCGTNCFGDLEKVNYFAASTYSSIGSPSVTAVKVTFYKDLNRGTGGANSVIVSMKLYAGINATTAPSTSYGGTTATMQQILAAQGAPSNTLFVYTYTLGIPIPIPAGGFFAGVDLPNTPGDTVVVADEDPAPVNNAWEKGGDNNWYDMSGSWTGLSANLAVSPIVCGQVATGLSKNYGLSKYINLMPNPSTGLVNISVSSSTPENLNVSVINALGQVVNTSVYNGITYDNLFLNLTDQPNGVYFVSITNGNDKMVQRLIINR